jgi:hypothetical protein
VFPVLSLNFYFYFISCLVIPARTDLLEAGSAGCALNVVFRRVTRLYQVCLRFNALYCHICLGLDVVPFRGPGLELGLGLGCVLGLGWSWLFWSWS